MGRYDAALKFVLQRWGSVIVEELTGAAVTHWHNTDLPKVSTQYADLLAETASGGLWHVELQSTNDPGMPLRMLEYATRVFRTFERFPEQSVLYVGREPLRMEAELHAKNLWFRYRLVDIRELDGERLLSSTHVGDNILAILTELRGSEETVRRVLNAIAGLEHPDREVVLEVFFVVAGLRNPATWCSILPSN